MQHCEHACTCVCLCARTCALALQPVCGHGAGWGAPGEHSVHCVHCGHCMHCVHCVRCVHAPSQHARQGMAMCIEHQGGCEACVQPARQAACSARCSRGRMGVVTSSRHRHLRLHLHIITIQHSTALALLLVYARKATRHPRPHLRPQPAACPPCPRVPHASGGPSPVTAAGRPLQSAAVGSCRR